MAEEIEIGCARPTGGPVGEDVTKENQEPATIYKGGFINDPGRKKSTGFCSTGIS